MAIASTHPSSPFAAWMQTNRTLPPSELDCLNRFLRTAHVELAELDQQIHEMQQALEQRKAGQARLKTAVDAHRSLLSPMRRLPAEVLQQIFLLCRAAHRMPLLRKEEAPILLTRVCSAWRNLALDTPHLWDSIHIPIPNGITKPSAQFHVNRAERWLERTKQVPLSISIWSPREKIEDGEEFLKQFLRRNVLDRATRIRRLELELNYTLLNFICTTLPPDSWATLEKVTLRCVDVGPVIEQMAIWEAPRLRGVVWESVKADIFNLPLAWDQLEEIKVSEDPRSRGSWDEDWDTFSASEAHALIRDSPNLRHLKMNIDDDGTQFFLEGVHHHYPISLENPLVLPHLTTLELYDMHLDPALGPVVFLRGLQLPVLESLTYQLPHGEEHPLIAFLGSQKEPIRIKALKIDEGWTMSQDDFLRCLEMMPLLEKVWVAYWSGTPPPSIQRRTDPDKEIAPTPSLLRRLQPSKRDPSQIVCPRLTSLRLDKMEDVEFGDIETFVKDRLALADAFPLVSTASPTSSNPIGVARLRHVHIGMPKLRPDHVPRSYGLNVRQPICALEEDLRELGIDARLVLWPANSEQDRRKLTKERYLPHCGLFYG
ncbi:hypothetical protein NMY22_g15540 [Coprinellus aureogranulatus]|nr:hypothetical protein NMY22_g15540 [Coprinellus aureogranulatus]